MDTEIAVDIMEMSHALDHIVLLSGDGDFRYLTETVQHTGVQVSLVSTVATKPPTVCDELRRQAINSSTSIICAAGLRVTPHSAMHLAKRFRRMKSFKALDIPCRPRL